MSLTLGDSDAASLSRPLDKPAPRREGTLDIIRAIATIRVVLWHTFAAPILSFFVASMPTTFFLAGSLLAASLDRRTARHVWCAVAPRGPSLHSLVEPMALGPCPALPFGECYRSLARCSSP